MRIAQPVVECFSFIFGRKTDSGRSSRRIIDDEQLERALHLIIEERLSIRKAADVLGVSHMTLHRALERAGSEG